MGGQAPEHCPISEHQFRVAAAEQASIESVQEQLRTLLRGRIVVGFAIDNDLKVLGVSRDDLMVRDVNCTLMQFDVLNQI